MESVWEIFVARDHICTFDSSANSDTTDKRSRHYPTAAAAAAASCCQTWTCMQPIKDKEITHTIIETHTHTTEHGEHRGVGFMDYFAFNGQHLKDVDTSKPVWKRNRMYEQPGASQLKCLCLHMLHWNYCIRRFCTSIDFSISIISENALSISTLWHHKGHRHSQARCSLCPLRLWNSFWAFPNSKSADSAGSCKLNMLLSGRLKSFFLV